MYAKSDDPEEAIQFGHPFGDYIPLAEYYKETKKPLPNLIFVLPMIVLYELCAMLTGHRNGADYIMGFVSAHITPTVPSFVILSTFMAWHLITRPPVNTNIRIYWLMLAESLVFACTLIMMAQVVASIGQHDYWAMYLGAGIYEEFLFRVCLIPAFYLVYTFLCFPRNWAIGLSAITTSIIFSLAHYDPITVATFFQFSFVFRAMAGMYFASIYLKRGYGIAVGSHAFYDILIVAASLRSF